MNWSKEYPMEPIRVLFVCQHNSARSQIAETYLRHLGKDRFKVESSGLEPTEINPLVIEIMKEEGFDLSNNTTTDVFDLFREGRLFQYVIAVCSPEVEKKCPMFPGVTDRLNWPFPDPAKVTGTHEEQLAAIRSIRDDIKTKIFRFVNELS